jgi:hypothetical protein
VRACRNSGGSSSTRKAEDAEDWPHAIHGRADAPEAYQPTGDLLLRFAGHERPRTIAAIWISTGDRGVRYQVGGVATREAFSSYPDKVWSSA